MEVNFGKLLKSMRMDRGLTQAKLAEMCGVTQSTIGVWENGVNVPSVENLYALTKALNLQPGILRAAVNGEPPELVDITPKSLPFESQTPEASNPSALPAPDYVYNEVKTLLEKTKLPFKWNANVKGASGINWRPDLIAKDFTVDFKLATNPTKLKASLFNTIAMRNDINDGRWCAVIVVVPKDSAGSIRNKAEQKTLEKVARLAGLSLEFVDTAEEAAQLVLAYCRLTGELKESDFYDEYPD